MWSATRASFSAPTTSSTMLTRAIRTNPSDALRADKPAGPIKVAAAGLVAECNVRCTPPSALSAARTPRCRSCPEATDLYIAAIASGSSVNEPVDRLDTRHVDSVVMLQGTEPTAQSQRLILAC